MRIQLPIIIGCYAIDVGDSIDEKVTSSVYQVLNTVTGVVEAETSSLPRAIMSTQSADLALETLLGEDEPSIEELLALESNLDSADNGNLH